MMVESELNGGNLKSRTHDENKPWTREGIAFLINRTIEMSRFDGGGEANDRLAPLGFLSDVGKEECEMSAAHPSFNSRPSYHLAQASPVAFIDKQR